MIPEMGHLARPAQHHFVVRSEGIFDHNIYVRERAPNAFRKWNEVCWPTKFNTVLKFTDCNGVGSKKIMNSLDSTFIPYFFEPTPHQRYIFFDRHCPSCAVKLLMCSLLADSRLASPGREPRCSDCQRGGFGSPHV